MVAQYVVVLYVDGCGDDKCFMDALCFMFLTLRIDEV